MNNLAFAIYLECIYQERLALNRVDAARGVCPGRVLSRRGIAQHWRTPDGSLARYWFDTQH